MRLHRPTLTAFGPFAGGRTVGHRGGRRPYGGRAAAVLAATAAGRRAARRGTGPDTAERGVLRDAFDAVRSDAVRAEAD